MDGTRHLLVTFYMGHNSAGTRKRDILLLNSNDFDSKCIHSEAAGYWHNGNRDWDNILRG